MFNVRMQFGSRAGTAQEIFPITYLLRNLRDHERALARHVERGLVRWAEVVFNKSQYLCPVDKGKLRGTAELLIDAKGFDTMVKIIYPQIYAIYVHEDLTKRHDPPTMAKFLEIPLREYRRELPEFVRREIRGVGKSTIGLTGTTGKILSKKGSKPKKKKKRK